MNWLLIWLTLVLSSASQAASLDGAKTPSSELKPSVQQSQAANLASVVVSRYHYKPEALDDALSAKIFDRYLKELDPEKVYFTQADLDQLGTLRTKLDDAFTRGDLAAPFSIFNLYTERVMERHAFARTLLKDGFDFSQHEDFQYSREKAPWASSEAEVREIWRKRVKNDWLRLKLAGKTDKNIVGMLDKRYETAQKRVTQLKSDDTFQAFMNAYTMTIEPHTNYMGPRASEEFDISMKLSLVGIGAVLAQKDEFTLIRELVPGGPAALSGQLKAGDRIVGVAQGKEGKMVDTLNMRLDETVSMIRGTTDSIVVLDILPADASLDGKHRQISLVRKKISLEEQSAKKSVLSVTDGDTTRRLGVITLSGFYEDVEARNRGDRHFKSATRDVAKLLQELRDDKVDGVLVDLRNNGGGSLEEAIALTGLFIGQGPVLQTRNAEGTLEVETNTRVGVAWGGPMGVLINRASASASEIFAAAIQDYGRGVIIGEPSFGKGTVQTMVDLDQIAKNDKPKFGTLKLTVAQFFRVNGGTTQLRGVTPDIAFPALVNSEEFGESSFENALPWMQVKAASYSSTGDLRLLEPVLLARHEARAKTDKDFQCLQDAVANIKRLREKNLVSLNEIERRKERDFEEAKQASCESGKAPVSHGSTRKGNKDGEPATTEARRDDGLEADERNLANDLAEENARKSAKDVLLNEAVHIVSDEVGLLMHDANVAMTRKPVSLEVQDQRRLVN